MAITKIWAVRFHLNRLLDYVSDIGKVNGPRSDQLELATIQSVIGYAGENYKTEQRMYVSGVNVSPNIAARQMVETNADARKPSDIAAWHAVQSFAPGEVTPEQCHEIGVKLAQQLWGDKYEVIVATHLDRNHLHNHFVVNAVSFVDGKRFPASKATYREMRRVNDELCRQYSLSVIRNPKSDRTLSYNEWQKDRDGKPTIRNQIRADIDEAIRKSFNMNGFFSCLREKGYRFHLDGKYPSILAPGAKRYLRLYKMGERYDLPMIERRLAEPKRNISKERELNRKVRAYRVRVRGKARVLFPGIRAFYFRTLYEFGVLPKVRKGRRFYRMSEQERKITAKVDRMSEELRVLSHYRISTKEEAEAKLRELNELVKEQKVPYEEELRLRREIKALNRAIRRAKEREKEKEERYEH